MTRAFWHGGKQCLLEKQQRVVDIEMRAQVSNREGGVISRAFEASCSICM